MNVFNSSCFHFNNVAMVAGRLEEQVCSDLRFGLLLTALDLLSVCRYRLMARAVSPSAGPGKRGACQHPGERTPSAAPGFAQSAEKLTWPRLATGEGSEIQDRAARGLTDDSLGTAKAGAAQHKAGQPGRDARCTRVRKHVSGHLLMWGSARLPCAFGQLGISILLALMLGSSALQL